MAYYVAISPRVEDYINSIEELSDAGRADLIDGIIDELGRGADEFLRKHQLGPESLHFRYDYVQPDGRTLFIFEFVVDGTHMASGVVTVVYADCEVHRPD